MKSRERELAERLVRRGALEAERRDVFAARLETLGGDAVRSLGELGVPEERIRSELAALFDLEFPDGLEAPVPASLSWALDHQDFLSSHAIHPYADEGDSYLFLVSNVFLCDFATQLEMLLGRPVRFAYCEADVLDGLYKKSAVLPEAGELQGGDERRAEDGGEGGDPESPIIKAVNLIFLDALNEGASDIHVEPFENQLQVRFRVDGVLRLVKTFPMELQPAVLSRIKLMAGMNIAERRVPQDGRIKFQLLGADYDMRVSTIPTVHGETSVLRLLKKESISIDLGKSGFLDETLAAFRAGFTRAHGICLVTGPTGSGKTTTLYGAVNEINDVGTKIFTIEDPVEYQLPGIVQIPVQAKVGMTFAAGLRAALRQDPDIIMIGEIRDGETAEIAVKSALTGHLVLATLHTNSAPGAVSRLIDMGCEPFMLASTLEVVLAQRLQRRICPDCRESFVPDAKQRLVFRGVGLEEPEELFRGAGCETCGGSGHKGRLGVHEILVADEAVSDAVAQGLNEGELTRLAKERGMIDLRQDSLIKVARGWTSLEETIRVTGGE